ncbi:MAG: tyrosyl-tRNA synthetase [Candidatus Berkelbacteria bacterium]|nr:tyrosyl-tRNA synthetase [Candidatus Berkelbacteria bacterium]
MAVDIKSLLERGVGEIIVKESLEKKLASGKNLRVKYGIDPNKGDIHLGHAVPIRKLKTFQDLGHTAVFIIGDYTARIGDPSAKDKTREMVSEEVIKKNSDAFFTQSFRILDKEKTEIHLQSEWFKSFNLAKVLEIASKVSVAQIMEHETFKKRIEKNQPFGVHEEIYPILQGYDSVMVKADIELGGTDQKFNLLMGRQLQKAYGQPEQDIVMMNYLIGLDGKEKMSKSLGNYIAINDSPRDMYGKVMSIPDNLIVQYYELCTDITTGGLDIIRKELDEGKNARDIKAELAKLIVEIYYSASDAEDVEIEFDKVFRKGGKPSDMPIVKMEMRDIRIDDLLMDCKLTSSRSASRRLIEQGAVEVSGKKITDPFKTIQIQDDMIVQVGKRNFVKIKI